MRAVAVVFLLLAATFALPVDAAARCKFGGDVVADDANGDGGVAGTASEILCLRAYDDADAVHFLLDLAGTGVDPALVDEFAPLLLDVHVQVTHTPYPVRMVAETQWNGATLRSYMLDPVTLATLPGAPEAWWEGSTLHVRVLRSDLFSPEDGDRLERVFAEVLHCAESCSGYVRDDLAPEGKAGLYTFGVGPSGGDRPCKDRLTTDGREDSTSPAGAREITRVSVSEDAATWRLCIRVDDLQDGATGATPEEARTRFDLRWDAEYEMPGRSYVARVAFEPDGTLSYVRLLRGVAGFTAGVAEEAVAAYADGDMVVVTINKAGVGAPQRGETTAVSVTVGDDTDGNGVVADAAPDAGAVAYVFR